MLTHQLSSPICLPLLRLAACYGSSWQRVDTHLSCAGATCGQSSGLQVIKWWQCPSCSSQEGYIDSSTSHLIFKPVKEQLALWKHNLKTKTKNESTATLKTWIQEVNYFYFLVTLQCTVEKFMPGAVTWPPNSPKHSQFSAGCTKRSQLLKTPPQNPQDPKNHNPDGWLCCQLTLGRLVFKKAISSLLHFGPFASYFFHNNKYR